MIRIDRLSILIGFFAFLYTTVCLWLAVVFLSSRPIGSAQAFVASNPTNTVPPTELLTRVETTAPTSTEPPTPTATPTARPSTTATRTRAAATVKPTRTPTRPAPRPTVVEHFIVGRPVATDAPGKRPSWFYLYGTTEQGNLAPHHGVEFVNPTGTPLYAVGDGVVVVAGSDDHPLCGPNGNTVCGEQTNYYGNLVVLKLNATFRGQAVYALYGHMDEVAVHAGDRVRAGQRVGAVGETGVAQGPHLHFEVRLGVDDYAHTRNPVLWLKPLPGMGVIAGLVVGANGQPASGVEVDLLDKDGTQVLFSGTYEYDNAPPVNGDDNLHENFGLEEVTAGSYQLRVRMNGRDYIQPVNVVAGHVTFVTVRGN